MPALRYRNVAAAIDWLCAAFGFERHYVVTGEEGAILYAHLTLGNDMIVVWPVRDSRLDRLMKQPDEIGGAETQTCYFVVTDADVHYRNAKAAGADFVLDINDDDQGGRGYSCRDPEGHIWSFGTYDPWQQNPALSAAFPLATDRGKKLNRALIVAAIVASITAAATAGWMLPRQPVPIGDEIRLKHDAIAAHDRAEKAAARATLLALELTQERTAKDAAERAGLEAREQLTHEQGAKATAQRHARQLADQLAEERLAKDSAERTAKDAAERAGLAARAQLAHEQGAKETAERVARQLGEQLTEERRAKDVAERTAKDAREQIAKERAAKDAAQRISSDAAKELTRERDAKQRAERSAQDALEQLTRERRAKEAAERVAKEAQQKLADVQSAKKNVFRPARGPPAGHTQQQNAKTGPAASSEPAMPRVVP